MIPKLNPCVASEMSNTHLKLYGKEQRGTKDMICHHSINLRYRHYEWHYSNHTLQMRLDWMKIMLSLTDLTYHQKQKSYNEKHLLQNYHLKMYRKVTNRNTSFDMPPLNQSTL